MTTYRIGPDVAWHGSDDEQPGRIAVLDLAEVGAVPFVLEGSAAAIWTGVVEHGGEGSEGVIAAVAERFGLGPADVGDDVRSFLAELVERRLIEQQPTDGALPGVTGRSDAPL